MDESQIHILNGDELKNQFPLTILGDIIVFRECLVDGDVNGSNLNEILETRARYMERTYGILPEEYREKTVEEFDKFKKVNADSVINLWFEDDLFCQVNLWYTAHLLLEQPGFSKAYLIRPTSHIRFGFGGMNEVDLEAAYNNRQEISPEALTQLGEMWSHYQSSDFHEMLTLSEKLSRDFYFIKDAVKAHIERFSVDGSPGRVEKALLKIAEELGTKEFAPIFREFSKQEGIYGFGDMHMKKIHNEVFGENSTSHIKGRRSN